tara:strand:+ start:65 stop:289 length:225 start_codon:yes stop_codon:yes gene_type:complete
MSKYTILDDGMGGFDVKEKRRTHTNVRWITIENTINNFKTLEEAKQKYPNARVSNLGEKWWDDLARKQNMPSNG